MVVALSWLLHHYRRVTPADPVFNVHPDRLFPADANQRGIARRLHGATAGLPLVCPHGHVEPCLLADNQPFPDPASLFVTPDHYVTRLLHADGVALEDLGIGQGRLPEAAARAVWRRLCERWAIFAATPVRWWLEAELNEIFGVTSRLSAETADATFDQVATHLADEAFRPRALYERFNISVLTTTADPCDDLAVYSALDRDPSWSGRVIPAFRPDPYLEPSQPEWNHSIRRLGEAADVDTGSYRGYIEALESRRRYFLSHGATSADHSHPDARTDPLGDSEADRIFRSALAGDATQAEAIAFRRHMLFEMARMSCDDGLVMTLHCGVRRDHHPPSAAHFGSDIGADIPLQIEFTDALRPVLERFGIHPGFHLVVFTLDETVWSRELAPMAGFYPSVYVGVPWWFLDAPDAIGRFRAAVSETVGFTRTSGFVDDTRAFCSIPARHDMARRLDAGFLARLVSEHRLDEDEAAAIAADLVIGQPARVFKL